MKTKIAILMVAGIIAVSSLCLADTTGSSPKPADDLATVHMELKQTQAQLEQVIARTSVLEEQVRALEQPNATLQQEVRKLQMTHWVHPQTNQAPQVPHLVPLQTK